MNVIQKSTFRLFAGKLRTLSVILVLMAAYSVCNAQNNSDQSTSEQEISFKISEQKPKYPGGEEALRKFLATNINYPIEAKKKGIKGTVLIKFAINEEGNLSDLSVVQHVDNLLDEEALRIVKLLPKWDPAKEHGKAVNTWCTIPINFRLRKHQKESKEKIIYSSAEVMPIYPGGEVALIKFLQTNIKFPYEARINGMEGKVFVRFMVDKNGDVTKVKIAKKVNPMFDEEALRVVKLQPRWIPGKDRGETVNVWFTVPINFVLSRNTIQHNPPNQVKSRSKSYSNYPSR